MNESKIINILKKALSGHDREYKNEKGFVSWYHVEEAILKIETKKDHELKQLSIALEHAKSHIQDKPEVLKEIDTILNHVGD